MSYAGKLDLKLKAQKLRKQGLSVKEIEKKLKVSRSSVSLWVRNIRLTRKQLEKLYLNKKTGQLKGSIIAAMNKIKIREAITKTLMEEGEREVGRISQRNKFIIGIALYFAEGNKSDEHIGFSNSDPRAIKFIADWFRKFCKIPKEKFRCSLYIHDNLNESEAKNFWSKLTKIPLSQFTKSYIVKNNPNRLRKTINSYGVLRIGTSDVNLHRKIMGWISGVFKNSYI
ncbi:helix-turn-helix domain-containing protein [Candidatus Atribacteria bacterium MT.SAG.1]|nr:helix-turn-helix domain-containing protein [Candidatus Atribacteria bacterium MT.SAG.1]